MSFAFIAVGVAAIGLATSVTMGIMSARNQRAAAKRQLEARSLQAKQQAENRIRQIRKLAASQKSSFLASGIALTGEGTTDAVISETYDIGQADVDNILQNGAIEGAAIQANARAKMLSTYGQMASDVSSYASSMFGGMSKMGGAGTEATGVFDDVTSMDGGLNGMGEFGSFDSAHSSFGNVQIPNANKTPSFGGQPVNYAF